MAAPENTSDVLLALEQRLLDTTVRRLPCEVEALLADDFCEFGSSGRVYDKPTTVERLRKDPGFDGPRTIVDFHARQLSATVALASYRIRETGTLRSSIWRSDQGRWRMIFHQGTPGQRSEDRLRSAAGS